MLDLPRLERIELSASPRAQKAIALGMLLPNYNLPPRTTIRLVDAERLPSEPVLYAMNHTDRYNYWPFQYRLWRSEGRFTATWVKGKYYEHPFVARFMELTNNIPTVSRGYLIARDFLAAMERKPTAEEYGWLRARVDAAGGVVPAGGADATADIDEPPPPQLSPLFERPRDMLGRPFDPRQERWELAVDRLFRSMMARFVELNERAFELGLDLLVFPQGTRSKRLSRGHGGISQIALKYRKTIVPVGCSGSDHVYPTGSPLAKGGEIVYRIGQPIPYEEMAPFHVPEHYVPFTAEAENAHRDRFQGLVDLVMERIDGLVDPPYRFATDGRSDGVQGTDRFL